MTVKVLRWPTEARERERYRALGVPRLLVLEGPVAPPVGMDALEDWVRPPISPEELRRRSAALRARALAGVPVIDGSDILRFGGRWIALSPSDATVMRALVDAYQCLVEREDLVSRVWPGSEPRRNALDLRVLRLRRKIAPLHLMIRTVWRKGYLLDSASPDMAGP
jgi:two-component system OmpR family response regulator